MVGKFYAIKDQDAVKKGTVISTAFALIVAGGSYLLGGFDRLFCTTDAADTSGKTLIATLSNGKPEFDAMIPAVLQTALPDLLIGLVVVLVLSASMSTLSSLVLTSSSTLTIDMIKPAMKKSMTDKKEVTIMRALIGGFLLISVLIAFNKTTSISTLMSYSWGALAGAFLAPFLYGLYWKRVTKAAVWASFIAGVGITVSNMFINYIASPINAGALAMIAGLIRLAGGMRLTRLHTGCHCRNRRRRKGKNEKTDN